MSGKFDGNLVFVAQKETIDDGSFYFQKEESGKFLPTHIDQMMKGGLDLKQLRLRFSLLLNSPGGWMPLAKAIMRIADLVKANVGRLSAFGGADVASAAAEMFIAPSIGRRILASNAELLFHMSPIAYSSPNPHKGRLESWEKEWIGYQRGLAIQHLSDLLMGKATRKAQREKMRLLLENRFANSDPTHPDCPLSFGAREAERLGWAKIGNLKVEFEKFNRVDLGTYEKTKIEDFLASHDEVRVA